MYKSKLEISNKNRKSLEFKLQEFLAKHRKIHCKALGRKVSLGKLPQIIIRRNSSVARRLKRFFVTMDILKNEKDYFVRKKRGCLEYEIKGLDKNGNEVYIHLREELSTGKDKVLVFLSCY